MLEPKLNGLAGTRSAPLPAPPPHAPERRGRPPREQLLRARLELSRTRERFARLSQEFTDLQEEFFEEVVLFRLERAHRRRGSTRPGDRPSKG